MVDVYHEGNIMVCCLLAIMVVGGGLEGGLTGVTKKSAVREQVVDFCSGWVGDGCYVEKVACMMWTKRLWDLQSLCLVRLLAVWKLS